MKHTGTILAGALLAVLGGCGDAADERVEAPRTDDHLGVELRAEVEALKASVATTPTNAENIMSRSRVLADWVDAHALAGRAGSPWANRVRENATTMPSDERLAAQADQVDEWIREYTLRDEEPEALGALAADSLGPFEATTYATIKQTWTAGSRGMQPGGGIWIARHFSTLYGEFQTDDPSGAGYISIATSDDDARFEPTIIMASGAHGGFRAPEPAIAFRLIEGTVDSGETVTVTYGETSAGGPGLMITTVSGESVPLPFYVALDDDLDWLMLPIQPFVISGTRVAGVHGFAPSIVDVGETFELSIRAEDAYYNRATGPIPAFDVLINGAVVGSTQAGNEPIQVLTLTLEEPGAHWVDIRSADGDIQGIANPILVEENPIQRIFWGDTHGHSGYAEGIGTVDYFMRFARDEARLDFVTHSEHDTALDEAEWRLMRDVTAAYDVPGKFTPYLGYEWTVVARRGGHHNVLYRTIADRERISALEYPTLSVLYQALRERYPVEDVVIIPHAHNPGDARHSDPDLEPLIEVMSMHGTFEWFMRNYLSNGHQIGFVAASDDHLSHPGYSAPSRNSLAQRGGLGAVFAPEHSRDAIFDGMRARRTYATTGDRMILDVTVNDAPMGQRAQYAEARSIEGRVIGTAPIESITVFKNDAPIWSQDYLTDTEAAPDGEQTLHVTFSSDATPLHWGDAPRGWRHWRGTLRLEGGRIVDARSTDIANPNFQSLLPEGDGYRFATITRGDPSSIRLTVSDLTPDASIVLDIEEALETGSAPPFYRLHQPTPGETFRLPLADLEQGRLTLAAPAVDFTDTVELRRIVTDGEREVRFAHVDKDDPRQGDYYYVRVRQANDAAAWSSPIWVGGYSHR
jgi:hypothetical protein